jgi:hypothetical protein
MKKQSGPIRKFFSLNRWRRRWGANAALPNQDDVDLSLLKTDRIREGEPELMRGSHHDVMRQIQSLEKEFLGLPKLHHYHASLIVLIRREADLEKNLKRFFGLWQQEKDWLLANLSLRWLVSAADTLVDHDPDPRSAAMAFSTSVLINAVKAYESEKYFLGQSGSRPDYLEDKMAHVQNHLVPLFGGLSCYTIGSDDTLRNMVWRAKALGRETMGAAIFLSVLNRLAEFDTPFAQLKIHHTRQKTQWWG